jgi:hypothetical protein
MPPLCNYKVWIDAERDAEAKRYLRSMVDLNTMEEEFCTHRMKERRRAAFFARQREMDREEYQEKREQKTRVRKHDMRRKCMSEVVMKRSGKPSGQVLLKIDEHVRF